MSSLKTMFLLSLLTGLMILAGGFFGGQSGMMFMFVIAMGMNFFSYWYSDKIVLKMYGAREVTQETAPDLVKMVKALAEKAKLPMPKVYIMETNTPNAFATGRDPAHGVVAVTTGIMRALNYEELEGVVAHELSHIKNRDTLISTIAATIAGVITMIANMAKWAAIFGRGHDDDEGAAGLVGMLFLMIIAPLAAMIIQMSISRSREYLADETGGIISGKPLALANALKKIETYSMQKELPHATPATSHMFIINPLSGAGGFLAGLFSTHPKTKERVAKLEELAKRLR